MTFENIINIFKKYTKPFWNLGENIGLNCEQFQRCFPSNYVAAISPLHLWAELSHQSEMNQRFFILLLSILFSVAAKVAAQSGRLILVSKSNAEKTYEKWLLRQDQNLRFVSIYHVPADSVDYFVSKADGFLMTGGEDIYPARYGKEKDTVDCGEFDLRRDSLEFRLLDAAFRRKKPVFGVCRGLQLVNVYLGGSLIVDIPSSHLGTKVQHRQEGPVYHSVLVYAGSDLKQISASDSGMVLSNHHQGIEFLGKGLQPMAGTKDGLIEAITQIGKPRLPFLMAVQWHPERMEPENKLSSTLAAAFIKACKMK